MTDQARNRMEQTKAYLYDCLRQSPFFEKHPAKLDYRYQHSLRTAHIASRVAQADGLDEEALVLGCLLHDISYCREFADQKEWLDHGRTSAHMARPWLLQLGLEPERVEEICYGIAIHVDDKADFDGPRTKMAEDILMIDNIDRFDCYRMYEVLENAHFSQMQYEEQIRWLEGQFPKLEMAFQFAYGSPTAIRLWREKARYHLDFYKKLYAQLTMDGTAQQMDSDRNSESYHSRESKEDSGHQIAGRF